MRPAARPGIHRPDFIKLIGGGAVTWPLAARMQQPAMSMIRFLSLATADDLQYQDVDDGVCGEM